jgi:DNA-binding Lrp family transcriptional regulator
MSDWRERIDDVDARLIDGYQSDFPVERRPFGRVADELDTTEDDALERVRTLRDEGIFRRFGAVLNPPVIGSSTLAAVKAPEDRLEEVASVIDGYRQVNHNYRRAHEWNLWFVVTAGSQPRRDEILAEIEERTRCPILIVPMLTDYYIDLEFPVVNEDRFARESLGETDVTATRMSESARGDLDTLEVEILLTIQDGFPLTATPYADIASEIGVDVDAVIDTIVSLRNDGCIKRIGCIVNHVVTGFDNNCMVVWDVPTEQLDDRGVAVGRLPYVTLCYHRPRRPQQDWPYNLFTMIHGRDSAAVDEKIDDLAAEYLPFEHERLYTEETLKQTGARYEDLVTT